MAKKLSKLLAFAAVAGAAAGAVYYYKSRESSEDNFDVFDDFEDEDDLFEGDDELEEYLDEDAPSSDRPDKRILDFIPLNLSSEAVDEARATIKQAASEIGSTVIGTAHKVSGIVKPVESSSNDDIEEFDFIDFDASEDDFEDAEADVSETDTAGADAAENDADADKE